MNAIKRFSKYIKKLDTVYRQSAKTAVLDGDNELVKMGANAGEFEIPMLNMDGLGDYDRNSGYAKGSVSITYQTKKADYDRGRKFDVDAMDNEETAGLLLAKLSAEFVRTKVVPELDAYRFAKYAAVPGATVVSGKLASGSEVLAAIRDAKTAMDEAEVSSEGRILFITPTALDMAKNVDKLISKDVLNEFEIVPVPQRRFHTGITLYDGRSDDELSGGYAPAEGAYPINFMIVDKAAIIQFTKHNVNKAISPEENQSSDAWAFFFRSYGIADFYENKTEGIYVHHGADPVTATEAEEGDGE